MKSLDVITPLVISILLLNVRDAVILPDTNRRPEIVNREKTGFQQDYIHLPEIIIEDYEQDIRDLIKLPFDTLWNASGWSNSPNFVNGRWEKIGYFQWVESLL